MKQKLLAFLLMGVMAVSAAFAQDRTITGTVTAKEDGLPLPGVSVKVVGSTTGTSTGADGRYSLRLPEGSTALQFTFIGYLGQRVAVGSNSVINVVLETDSKLLTEVVVTALGERREKKALGYAVGEVKAEQLTVAKSTDISTSLAGKVSGVQLVGSPSSSFDNANLIIRGVNGLSPTVGSAAGGSVFGNTTGNPLYVIDGTPTDQNNVLMDNVENISVLKGPAATALYGNRASNGVIVITTKKGNRNSKPSIEVNLSSSFENLSLLPEYQNEYAGGYASASRTPALAHTDAQGFPLFHYDNTVHPASWAAFEGHRMLEYGADESWGPKISGQQYRPYYSWFPGADFGQLSSLTAQPDNVTGFFRTGRTLNNSIAFSGGGESLNYRITYANQNRTLILDNANRDQHQVGLSGAYDINKRFSVMTDMTFTRTFTKGQPLEGYRNDGLNVTQGFNQWFQRQLDVQRLKNYRNPDGSLISWNIGDPNASGDPAVFARPQYWDSPYFVQLENYGTNKRTRMVGNLGFRYKLNEIFSVSAYGRMNTNFGNGDFRIATGGLQQDEYSTNQFTNNEMNYEASLNFKKNFSDISLDGFVGGNIRRNRYELLENRTQGGLTFPNYFDIAASVARPVTSRTVFNKDVRSVYGKASLGYKSFLYLEGSLRNDWSSALPADNNSYLYPSISSSFVFSELLGGGISKVLSYAKVRASYAQVGSDLDPYNVNIAINNGSIFDGNASAAIGNQFRTGAVKPALTKSWEVGSEVKLFNKLGIDFAYYVDNNVDQIVNLDVAPASGFTTAQINAGNIQRKGWELSFNGTPVKSKSFNWDVTLNFAHTTSIVKELSAGLDNYLYATSRGIRVENRVGQEWGVLVGQTYKYDAQGRQVFTNATGSADFVQNQELGNVLPDLTGGMFNSLSFKGIDLSFSLDFQKGGNFLSQTKMFNVGTGVSKFTTGVNDKGVDIREFPSAGGGIHVQGVRADGTPVDTYVPARTYFYSNYQRDHRNLIIDASYLKLREVRLGYSLPSTWIRNTPAKNVNLGFIVGNAWLIAAPGKKWGVDPSELENFWTEGGQLSATRQFGFNLRASF